MTNMEINKLIGLQVTKRRNKEADRPQKGERTSKKNARKCLRGVLVNFFDLVV